MFLMSFMSILCVAGVAFYLRFLIALCRDPKPRLKGDWMFLRLDSHDEELVELQSFEQPTTRAA